MLLCGSALPNIQIDGKLLVVPVQRASFLSAHGMWRQFVYCIKTIINYVLKGDKEFD